jgi:hypothetical protein
MTTESGVRSAKLQEPGPGRRPGRRPGPERAVRLRGSSVVPILFVPTNWSVDSEEIKTDARELDEAFDEIRVWWDQQLGKTFALHPVQVVQANSDRETYGINWRDPSRRYQDGIDVDGKLWSMVPDELRSREYPVGSSSYSTPIFVKGAGGRAGGNGNPDGLYGGRAILGDWAIDSIVGRVAAGQYWWSGRNQQMGSIAHEIGHTFLLPHSADVGITPNDHLVMQSWWNFPNVGFDKTDRDLLDNQRNQIFFKPSGDYWVPVGSRPNMISGIQIQAPRESAKVRIRYVNEDGTVAAARFADIALTSSITDLPAGFKGAVHISPRGTWSPLQVMANHVDNERSGAMSSSSGLTGTRRVLLPLLMSNNGTFSTRVTVANLGAPPGSPAGSSTVMARARSARTRSTSRAAARSPSSRGPRRA